MSWNNGKETAKFIAHQAKQRKEYAAVGMTKEQIQAMYEFDLETFRSDRRFYEHTQSLETLDCEKQTAVDENSNSRYWWIEEIDNQELVQNLKKLKADDLELLTLYVFEKYNQSEIAEMQGISQAAVSQKLKTLKKIINIFATAL